MSRNIMVFEGKVERNPYGNWSDVDRGIFVDRDYLFHGANYCHFLDNLIGRRVRITVEEIYEEED